MLLLSPPGAGKGTQGGRLAEAFDLEHITTGDALRANKDMETDYGTPREYMDSGQLVPDGLVNEIVEAAIADSDGFILDGYPRNLSQVEHLNQITEFDAVVFLAVGEGELIRRLTGRRVDPETGDVYHTEFNMPDDDEIADRLEQREDDTEEVVKDRLEVYRKNTEPVVEHYRGIGELTEVDGEAIPILSTSESSSRSDWTRSPTKQDGTLSRANGLECNLFKIRVATRSGDLFPAYGSASGSQFIQSLGLVSDCLSSGADCIGFQRIRGFQRSDDISQSY